MDFPARKHDGRLVLSPETARMQDAYVKRLPEDALVMTSMRQLRPEKTNQQVKCHWGLVIGTIKAVLDDRGIDLQAFLNDPKIPPGLEVPREVIQSILYACCNDVGESGKRKTLSKMDIAEAGRFFERCQYHAASAWEIQIPNPDPAWRETARKTAELRGTDGPAKP